MDSESIEEMARRWFAKRQGSAWSEADQAAFDAWIEAAIAHRIHYVRVETAWEQLARLQALGAGVPEGVVPPRSSWGDQRFPGGESLPLKSSAVVEPRSRTQLGRYAAAAVLVVSVIATYIYSTGLLTDDRYSTPVGGLDSVALDDGSHVILNTDSRIRVALREHERRISLTQGEAFFDVAKDASRPFVVEAGDKRIVAVGTKFSVRRTDSGVQVVVTEGSVRVETGGGAVLRPKETLLKAGSIAQTAEDDDVSVRPDVSSEIDKLLSWREGYVAFETMTLAEAVAEFNRYNARKIVIASPTIGGLRISGKFRTDNTDAFLWLLQKGFPVDVERRQDEIVLNAR
ncbi:FecR family protein [Steroidobacter sp.]|uniref:FecR family protein n=1 Tax=Steroidobacter sp. TaxID=1978227 RepID=UPI001A5D4F75|nr:FecR domain-containing protein [Steroidobacter sp.]MBL8266569.1 FecR domain-containing protein [Steroidobacter sp.]